MNSDKTITDFLSGKTSLSLTLFNHFIDVYKTIGDIDLHAAKTMIAISNKQKRIAWITQFGRNFVHIVFPFQQPYPDNLCFTKIAQVPSDSKQYNHHFRMLYEEDVNDEVKKFMKIAYSQV